MMPMINEIGETLEGNIFSLHTKNNYYDLFLNKQKNIINTSKQIKYNGKILEIGFNSGFSALLMLMTTDESIKITCVDINCHSYTVPCYHLLKKIFGDRIELLIGDSTVVVPQIKEKFDLIHIDGCHYYEIAEKDIHNSLKLANENCLLIMDDTDFEQLGKLWNENCAFYNLKDVDFKIYPTNVHSIKRF